MFPALNNNAAKGYKGPGKIELLGAFFWENPKTDLRSQIIRILPHQRNRRILVQSGFVGSFDAAWSEWSEIANPFSDSPKKTHPLKGAGLLLQASTDNNHCCRFNPVVCGIISPLWIKLLRFGPDIWITMNCIRCNHDWHSFRNVYTFDSTGLVAISLKAKARTKICHVKQNKGRVRARERYKEISSNVLFQIRNLCKINNDCMGGTEDHEFKGGIWDENTMEEREMSTLL